MRADAGPENLEGSYPNNNVIPLEFHDAELDAGGAAAGKTAPTSASSRGYSAESEIHHYAQSGDVEKVRRCLLGGISKVDEVDELGCTAVHLAGAMGHADVVRLLVEEHGASVDARDGAFCTALHAASEGGHPVVVELLLRLGAEIDARNGKEQTPLHYACGYGQVDAAQQLTLRGASTGARDIQGNTPLHLACGGGKTDVVRLLLTNGSPLQALNHRGRRPLHLACRSGHLDIAVTLLENGADPSARDANGMQAIDMIGAKRRIPQGVRFDLVNTLERYLLGDFTFASHTVPAIPVCSRESQELLPELDKIAPADVEGTRRRDTGQLCHNPGRIGNARELLLERGTLVVRRISQRLFDGGRLEGEIQGSFAGVGVPQRSVDRRDDDFFRGEESKQGVEEAGGRSTQWAVGAAVAGRLEEMRARELGASLRAKVQENEAMKRYLDSVKEEMRMLQQKLLEQSSARSNKATPFNSLDIGPNGSIAEKVAHTMYGEDGIGVHLRQARGAEAAAAAGVVPVSGTESSAFAFRAGRGIAGGDFASSSLPAGVAISAPSHGSSKTFCGSGVVVEGRPSTEAAVGGGSGFSDYGDQPAGPGAPTVSMSQLLMAKRAQLQSLLDMHQPGRA